MTAAEAITYCEETGERVEDHNGQQHWIESGTHVSEVPAVFSPFLAPYKEAPCSSASTSGG